MAAQKAAHFLGVTEAAAELALSVARVRHFCDTGRLVAHKVGKTWVILVPDLETFKQEPRVSGYPRGRRKRK